MCSLILTLHVLKKLHAVWRAHSGTGNSPRNGLQPHLMFRLALKSRYPGDQFKNQFQDGPIRRYLFDDLAGGDLLPLTDEA